MANTDIHQDLHDEFIHMRDHNGIPLYLHAIQQQYYTREQYEKYISPEDRAPIDPEQEDSTNNPKG